MNAPSDQPSGRAAGFVKWALYALANAVTTVIVKEILTVSGILDPLTRAAGGWVAGHSLLVLWSAALLASLALTGGVMWLVTSRLGSDPPPNPEPAIEQRLEDHRLALAERAVAHDWWQRPLPLRVKSRTGVEDARERVARWAEQAGAVHCALTGEPGAGKSGLIWWAAVMITEARGAVALLVPAERLHGRKNISLVTLLEIATPPLPASLAPFLSRHRKLHLLLDGLDELVGIGTKGDEAATAVLGAVMASLPPGAKVLVSSRTAPFAKLKPHLDQALPDRPSIGRDDYDVAFSKALGINQRFEVLELLPVRKDEAVTFLTRSNIHAAFLDAIASDDGWTSFLTSPLLLRFAETALPHLAPVGIPQLDLFYDLFVKSVLTRNNRNLDNDGIRDVMRRLRRTANVFRPMPRPVNLDAALRAGLLREEGGTFHFDHYSLWEFFFAGFLHEEIAGYNTETLARVDLVNGYNINRFLVPMVRRGLAKRSGEPQAAVLVGPAHYLRFLEATGWRRGTGYGLHPSVATSRDGVPSASFAYDIGEVAARHRESEHGAGEDRVARQLSWYDAAAFARLYRTRLPDWDELAKAAPRGNFLFWSSEWYDEAKGHIRVYDGRDGSAAGLNPDVRLPRTALAVVQ